VDAEIIIVLVRRATADQWCYLVINLAALLSGWLMAPMQALSNAVWEGKNGAEAGDVRRRFQAIYVD
jgi:hypothetical protein